MGKVRVWYHNNEKVSVSYPDVRPEKKPKDLTMDEWADKQLDNVATKAPQYAGLDYTDTDSSLIPIRDENRDRWRGTKTTGIRIDDTLVLRQDLLQQIDDELAKPSPSIIELERLRRKLERKEHD